MSEHMPPEQVVRAWSEAYVFFKHDETESGGSGPPAVATFVAACGC